MKRIITIIAVAVGLILPMQAQNAYIYKANGAAIKVSAEKLYFNTIEGENYITTEAEVVMDAIAGNYTVSTYSGFDGSSESWELTITRDEADNTKVWLHPICYFGGLTPAEKSMINPIYATYDQAAGTLSIPAGQCLYQDNTYNFVLGYATLEEANSPLSTGNIEASVVTEGLQTYILIEDIIGVGNLNGNEWWWQAVYNTVMYRDFGTDIVAMSEVDSISTVAPVAGGKFIENGDYTWNFSFTDDGEKWQELASTTTFTDKGNIDLGDLYGKAYTGFWAKEWSISDFMDDLGFFEGGKASPITGYSYSITYESASYELLDVFDTQQGFCSIGSAAFTDADDNTVVLDLYLGDVSETDGLTPYLYFSVANDVIGYDGEQLCIFYIVDEQAYLYAYISEIEISKVGNTPIKPLLARGKVEMQNKGFKMGKKLEINKNAVIKNRLVK